MGIVNTIVHNGSRCKVLCQRDSEAFVGTLDLLVEDMSTHEIARYWGYQLKSDKYVERYTYGKCDKYQKRIAMQNFIYK